MFKIVAVTVCWIACMAVIVTPAKVDTSVFDSLNIDKIMRNEGALNGYFKCLMEKGQCPPGGIELKKLVTEEALKNRCKDCTEKQKKDAEKIIQFIKENKKDMWKQLGDKYDPQGIYQQRYIKNGKVVFA